MSTEHRGGVFAYSQHSPLPNAKLYALRRVSSHICTLPAIAPATFVKHVAHCNFLERSSGMIIGLPNRACDFLKASVTIGELSVRMVVPIDMKKLRTISTDAGVYISRGFNSCIPERRC